MKISVNWAQARWRQLVRLMGAVVSVFGRRGSVKAQGLADDVPAPLPKPRRARRTAAGHRRDTEWTASDDVQPDSTFDPGYRDAPAMAKDAQRYLRMMDEARTPSTMKRIYWLAQAESSDLDVFRRIGPVVPSDEGWMNDHIVEPQARDVKFAAIALSHRDWSRDDAKKAARARGDDGENFQHSVIIAERLMVLPPSIIPRADGHAYSVTLVAWSDWVDGDEEGVYRFRDYVTIDVHGNVTACVSRTTRSVAIPQRHVRPSQRRRFDRVDFTPMCSERRKDGQGVRRPMAEMQAALALNAWNTVEANWTVSAYDGKYRVNFAVHPHHLTSLFFEREGERRRNGTRKAIAHWVAAHYRTLPDGKEVPVKTHFRGQREFSWRGLQWRIDLPGKHNEAARAMGQDMIVGVQRMSFEDDKLNRAWRHRGAYTRTERENFKGAPERTFTKDDGIDALATPFSEVAEMLDHMNDTGLKSGGKYYSVMKSGTARVRPVNATTVRPLIRPKERQGVEMGGEDG